MLSKKKSIITILKYMTRWFNNNSWRLQNSIIVFNDLFGDDDFINQKFFEGVKEFVKYLLCEKRYPPKKFWLRDHFIIGKEVYKKSMLLMPIDSRIKFYKRYEYFLAYALFDFSYKNVFVQKYYPLKKISIIDGHKKLVNKLSSKQRYFVRLNWKSKKSPCGFSNAIISSIYTLLFILNIKLYITSVFDISFAYKKSLKKGKITYNNFFNRLLHFYRANRLGRNKHMQNLTKTHIFIKNMTKPNMKKFIYNMNKNQIFVDNHLFTETMFYHHFFFLTKILNKQYRLIKTKKAPIDPFRSIDSGLSKLLKTKIMSNKLLWSMKHLCTTPNIKTYRFGSIRDVNLHKIVKKDFLNGKKKIYPIPTAYYQTTLRNPYFYYGIKKWKVTPYRKDLFNKYVLFSYLTACKDWDKFKFINVLGYNEKLLTRVLFAKFKFLKKNKKILKDLNFGPHRKKYFHTRKYAHITYLVSRRHKVERKYYCNYVCYKHLAMGFLKIISYSNYFKFLSTKIIYKRMPYNFIYKLNSFFGPGLQSFYIVPKAYSPCMYSDMIFTDRPLLVSQFNLLNIFRNFFGLKFLEIFTKIHIWIDPKLMINKTYMFIDTVRGSTKRYLWRWYRTIHFHMYKVKISGSGAYTSHTSVYDLLRYRKLFINDKSLFGLLGRRSLSHKPRSDRISKYLYHNKYKANALLQANSISSLTKSLFYEKFLLDIYSNKAIRRFIIVNKGKFKRYKYVPSTNIRDITKFYLRSRYVAKHKFGVDNIICNKYRSFYRKYNSYLNVLKHIIGRIYRKYAIPYFRKYKKHHNKMARAEHAARAQVFGKPISTPHHVLVSLEKRKYYDEVREYKHLNTQLTRIDETIKDISRKNNIANIKKKEKKLARLSLIRSTVVKKLEFFLYEPPTIASLTDKKTTLKSNEVLDVKNNILNAVKNKLSNKAKKLNIIDNELNISIKNDDNVILNDVLKFSSMIRLKRKTKTDYSTMSLNDKTEDMKNSLYKIFSLKRSPIQSASLAYKLTYGQVRKLLFNKWTTKQYVRPDMFKYWKKMRMQFSKLYIRLLFWFLTFLRMNYKYANIIYAIHWANVYYNVYTSINNLSFIKNFMKDKLILFYIKNIKTTCALNKPIPFIIRKFRKKYTRKNVYLNINIQYRNRFYNPGYKLKFN